MIAYMSNVISDRGYSYVAEIFEYRIFGVTL